MSKRVAIQLIRDGTVCDCSFLSNKLSGCPLSTTATIATMEELIDFIDSYPHMRPLWIKYYDRKD